MIAGNHDNVKYDEGEQRLGIGKVHVHAKYDGTKRIQFVLPQIRFRNLCIYIESDKHV